MTNEQCVQFLVAYQDTKIPDNLVGFYDDQSVFLESNGAGGKWTAPKTKTHLIISRVIDTDLRAADVWLIDRHIWQKFNDGFVVILEADDNTRGARLQIMVVIVNNIKPVIRNHIYIYNASFKRADWDELSFKSEFFDWIDQSRYTIDRYRQSFFIGTKLLKDYYEAILGDTIKLSKFYDKRSLFFCLGHVYSSSEKICERYKELAMDQNTLNIHVIDTCYTYLAKNYWNVLTMVAGSVSLNGNDPILLSQNKRRGCRRRRYNFTHILIIDPETLTVTNDVLHLVTVRKLQCKIQSTPSESSLSCSLSSSSPPSSFSEPDDWQDVTATTDDECPRDKCHKYDHVDRKITTTTDSSTDQTLLRVKIINYTVKIRRTINGQTCNYNPRQLFIGCVPVHVKYGQLKEIFQKFGEVTYVKIYDGIDKQTGVKRTHNYAFLFFKDEDSVEKAIAASPVPLDNSWSLNVSRPRSVNNQGYRQS